MQKLNGSTKWVAAIMAILAAGAGWGSLQTTQSANVLRIEKVESKLDKTYDLVVAIAVKQGIDTSGTQ